jgi:putative membrane protein
MTRLPLLAVAALLWAGAALAQAPATGASGATGAAGAGTSVARGDSKLMTDLAQANMAEIETGKLALEKSSNAEVKSFAQHMIDDHGAALKELHALAQGKGVKLPDGPGLEHKAMATALKATKGDTFDSQYIKRVGVGDHERTIKLLQKVQKDGKDADLKAMAAKMLPTVQQHLDMARQQEKAIAKK